MKYIFCVFALLIQPVFAWYVYHKQKKRGSALKVSMLCCSGIYMAVQMFIFVQFCIKFPEKYPFYAYLIQIVALAVFVVLELMLLFSNYYIKRVENSEQHSIVDFKDMIQELEICRLEVVNINQQKYLDDLLEKMRYSDAVSSPKVEKENRILHELIAELPNITEQELFQKQCDEITKQLEIRKIKNVKEHG